MDKTVQIVSAEDMFRLLQNVSRAEAANSVRAQHEKACWGCDTERAEFWQDVMILLPAYCGASQADRLANQRRVGRDRPLLDAYHKSHLLIANEALAVVQSASARHVP